MLTALGLTGTCVEVGTYQGDFALQWLQSWPGQLVCVDAWQFFDGIEDILNHPQALMEQCYVTTQERLAPFAHRCEIVRGLSVPTAQRFAEEGRTFDAVYLDAGHDVANITADIAAWWPLVKAGGLLAGHDYLDGLMKHGYPANFAVKSVVNAFAQAAGLPVAITTHESSPSWWISKP